MGELFEQMKQVFLNLLNPTELMRVLEQPEIMTAAFIAITLVIFTETGLLIGFFLPGDSLLVSVGIVCYNSGWPIGLLMAILSVAAIVGDSVGYWIGLKSGPRIFSREKSFFFRKDHLLAAQAFYEKHGGKTIILARFIPIVRTFAPFVAGIGQMSYPRFALYNVVLSDELESDINISCNDSAYYGPGIIISLSRQELIRIHTPLIRIRR